MSDGKKSEEKKPEKLDAYVTVVPKDDKNKEHQKTAEKVGKALKENVKRAIEESRPCGREQQFKAAEGEIKKAGKSASQSQIEKIRVRVVGTDEDGDGVGREWSVTPKEGKPAS